MMKSFSLDLLLVSSVPPLIAEGSSTHGRRRPLRKIQGCNCISASKNKSRRPCVYTACAKRWHRQRGINLLILHSIIPTPPNFTHAQMQKQKTIKKTHTNAHANFAFARTRAHDFQRFRCFVFFPDMTALIHWEAMHFDTKSTHSFP